MRRKSHVQCGAGEKFEIISKTYLLLCNIKDNIHIPIETLKSITDYENIKYELTQEEIKPLDTKNTSLILAQNNELIKYTNKLKSHLSKSYKAIEKVQELQKENTDLKYENENLKRENRSLKNYIQKTFEVVKHLFDFPIDRFKRLVDNFVKNMEK